MLRGILFILLTSVLVSCVGGGGGGEGGGSPATTSQLVGAVLAPGGQLAKSAPRGLQRWFAFLLPVADEAEAQLQGLSPVQSARIFVFQVNAGGAPVGGPLATTVTDSFGLFTATLPSGTILSPTLTVQAAASNATGPVAIGTTDVLNIPAVLPVVVLDPASELGVRRMVTVGLGSFSATAAAAYVGLIQAILYQVSGLIGPSITTTIANMQNHFAFQSEVLPALLDTENSAQVDQSLINGTYSFFAYHASPDIGPVPFHRTTEHGNLTFTSTHGTFVVSSNEFGGILKETCSTVCSRRFELQSFSTQAFNVGGLFFRTAADRLLFSAVGSLPVVAYINPTGEFGSLSFKSPDGELGLGMLVKQGNNISSADFVATFNYVDIGSILNQSVLNQAVVVGSPWTGVLRSRTGAGTVPFNAANSLREVIGFTGNDSTVSQQVFCSPSSSGCSISALLSSSTGTAKVAFPFTILSNGSLILFGKPGLGGMISDRSLYAATQTAPLHPEDISFSVVVRQPNGMTSASVNGIYHVVTLEDILTTSAQITTHLLTGTVQFDGTSSATFTTLGSDVDRTEGCPSGACSIDTTFTVMEPVNEMRTYGVTLSGVITFSGGSVPAGATMSGGVSPDASFFVVQMQADNVSGSSTRSITPGVREP